MLTFDYSNLATGSQFKAQYARLFCLSASGAQKLRDERERDRIKNLLNANFFQFQSVYALDADFRNDSQKAKKKYIFSLNERKIERRSILIERERKIAEKLSAQ